jgi:hypothetical protein
MAGRDAFPGQRIFERMAVEHLGVPSQSALDDGTADGAFFLGAPRYGQRWADCEAAKRAR